MIEEWKDIKGFEGGYQASSLGRFRSLDRETISSAGWVGKYKSRILKPFFVGEYKGIKLKYKLTGKRKNYACHRIVANAFLSIVEGKDYVDHINGDKVDNRVENLRWCTHRENDTFRAESLINRTSDLTGVSLSTKKNGNKFWNAVICIGGKSVGIGHFNIDEEYEAGESYKDCVLALTDDRCMYEVINKYRQNKMSNKVKDFLINFKV